MDLKADFVCFYDVNLNGSGTFEIYQAYNGFSTLGEEVPVKWIKSSDADKFVPTSDKVYVSCHYYNVGTGGHLEIVSRWAEKYPDVSFVAGGCIFGMYKLNSTVTKIPKNVEITADSLQNYLKVPTKRWYMSFPYKDRQLRYTFNNGSTCYWQGCNFCIATYRDGRPYKVDSYDFDGLRDAPNGRVYLSNPSTPPNVLRDMLPMLSDYRQYFTMFMRVAKPELEALKSIECNWSKFYFLIGVEFPSNRMLKVMNKGVTLKECMDMVEFLQNKKAGFGIYMIYDWPELLKKDLVEAQRFLDIVDRKTSLIYRPLYSVEDVGEVNGWKKFGSYKPAMSKRAIEANRIWLEMLRSRSSKSKTEEMAIRRKL